MLGDNAPDLIALAAVAEGRSFTNAAARRRVPQSALSHAVKGLAMRLGLRLLTCTARSAAPSAEGEDLLATLNPCFERIEARSQATAARATPCREPCASPRPIARSTSASGRSPLFSCAGIR